MKIEYGIQMFSIRDLAQKDLETALKTVAELGYKYIEFAGFHGNAAEDVAAWLKKYDLIVSGTHTGWKELTPETLAETIAYHKIIGNDTIIIPGFDQSSLENLNAVIDTINYAQPILAENGIRLGYHNHSNEFFKTSYGVYIEEELWNRTKVEFELDTFWVYNADQDPLDMMEKMKDRLIGCIHIKDGLHSVNGERAVGKALGEGMAPVKAVREKALEMGLTMIVESEGQKPTGPDEVGRCIKYLRSLDC